MALGFSCWEGSRGVVCSTWLQMESTSHAWNGVSQAMLRFLPTGFSQVLLLTVLSIICSSNTPRLTTEADSWPPMFRQPKRCIA